MENCPQCGHDVAGYPTTITNWFRNLIGLHPLPDRCSFDDGTGGDIATDGKCDCRDLFHTVTAETPAQ